MAQDTALTNGCDRENRVFDSTFFTPAQFLAISVTIYRVLLQL